ncbi:MAG TPA: hypothetical protein VFF77_04935 [Holophagaceae bacterium]|nr:hypothetical protein [Holophagaceae bacterium]
MPWFRWNAGTKQAIVLPRGPMLVSLDNTDGDADAVLKVGSYDTVHDLGLAYLGYAGATPASDVWTVPMGEKQTKVFTFLKDFLLVYVAGPFGTYPFVLQPMGLIERGCSSMPLASDGPFLTGGGA